MIPGIERFVDAGFSIHWLKEREKAPIGKEWQDKPVQSYAELRTAYRNGYNVGCRLGEFARVGGGYLHVFDMDIRLPSEAAAAWAALAEILPISVEGFPMVKSGSGGESRHVYFVTDRAFRSRKLITSGVKFDGKDGKRHWTWEIDLFGTGKQVAMPPSIHPDTGQPYTWLNHFDFDALDFDPPFIPSAAVEAAGAQEDADEPYDGLANDILTDITDADVRNTLLRLDESRWDYEHWFQMGMALHHQYRAGKTGLDIWEDVSSQRPNFEKGACAKKWRTFKRETKKRPVRFATVKGWLREDALADLADEFDDLDDTVATETDDFDELITAPAASDDWDGGTVEESGPRPGLEWISLLDPLEDGKGWRPTLHNVELIVKNDPRLVALPQLNRFTQETVQRTPPGRKGQRKNAAKDTRQLGGPVWEVADQLNGTIWSASRDYAVRSILEAPRTQGGYSMQVTDRNLKAATVLAAWENGFHPVQEYLDGLVWDGKPRVETLFIDYMGSQDNSYTRTVARMMMVAAVTRVFEPGHKYDFAVILEGLQGRGKSTFIRTLGKNWFAELEGDFHDGKEMVEKMQGAWIMEIPELSGFNRGDVQSIKAFISRQCDKVRLAYEARAVEFPRQCIFIGSTNDKEYLKDNTGGRRFWPIECFVAMIDIARLRANVDQLWAEARAIYTAMRLAQPGDELPLYLDGAEAAEMAVRLQESRRVESADDALAGQIAGWLDRPIVTGSIDDDEGTATQRNFTCLVEIWGEVMRGDIRSYSNANAQMIGRAMRMVPGWRTTGRLHNFPAPYNRQRFYERIGTTGPLAR